MSAPSTEAVMAALFALALSVNSANLPTPVAGTVPFKVMSRRFRHFNDVPAAEWPAFFQFQAPGRNTEGGQRGLPVHRMKVWWFVYLPGSPDKTTPCSPMMNQYYDALSNALLPKGADAGQGRNTLGRLVTNCYEDGHGLNDEGLLTTPSLIGIPITILTGV